MEDRTATINYSFWAEEYGNDPAVGPLDGRFWDCECETGEYIHLRSAVAVCDKCGAEEDNQPDSRAKEIA